MIAKLGGRKVIFGMIVITVGVAIALFAPGGLNTPMVNLLTFIATGFFLGNGIEHASDALKKKKPATTAAIEKITGEVAEISKQIRADMTVIHQQNATTQEAISFIIDATGIGKKGKKA